MHQAAEADRVETAEPPLAEFPQGRTALHQSLNEEYPRLLYALEKTSGIMTVQGLQEIKQE